MEESKILILIDKIFNFLNWVDWLIMVFIIIVIIFLFWKYRSKADIIIQILIVLTTIVGISITAYYTKTTSEKNLKLQKGQFDEQIKEQKRINKEQLSLQKSNTEVESLQNKINSCVDLRTKDREITFYESDGYDVNTGSLKSKDTKRKITGLTLNQAGYVCNAFYDNFEGVKQFFQEEFLYIPIDENEERSILHTTNLKNYTEIVEFIIKDKLLYYNKNLFETLSKGKKYTPLMYAVIDNNLNSVQYLLSKGVEIDTRLPDQNFLGDTAFTLAVKYNRREIAKYLKDNGADINIRLNGPFAGRNLFTHFSTLIDKEKLDLVIDLEVDPKIKIGENYFNSLYEILFINDNSKTEDLRLEYAKKIIEKYPNTLEDIKNNEKGEDIVALLNSNISDGRYKIAKYLLDLFPELKNNKDYRTFMDIFLSGVENNCSDKITNTSHKYLEELFKWSYDGNISYNKNLLSSFDDQKNFFLYLIKKDLIDTTKYSNKFIHITEIYTIDNFIEDIYKIKIIHDKDYIIKEVKKEINIVKKECENNYNYFINELEKINKKEN